MQALVAASQQAVAMIKDRLRPATEALQVNRLLDDLDSEQFAVRVKAREELEKLAEQAEGALRKRLAEKPPVQVCQQIEQILTTIEHLQPASESLRALRGIEVLEHIDSSEAQQALQTLAKGAGGARLTMEAKASLERLSRRLAADK
jgi:hypothetical protein